MSHLNAINRRQFLQTSAILAAGVSAAAHSFAATRETASPGKIPVIFDADIGDDIDDTWALAFLLRSPELDLKLAVGDYGMPDYRARLLAKLLQVAGRTDVPVGLGLDVRLPGQNKRQWDWVKEYDLKNYAGKIHQDGVEAIIELIMGSREKITVIGTGPLPNIAAALEREPRIAKRARFVGMHGSVRRGYGANARVTPEYNVISDPIACQKALSAPWEVTITPLDTCGLVTLAGEEYRRVRDSKDPLAAAVIENYHVWSKENPGNTDQRSSVLFDTVAIYLAFAQDFCKMEQLPIRVSHNGFTEINKRAKVMNVATDWKDLPGFRRMLVERLIRTGGA